MSSVPKAGGYVEMLIQKMPEKQADLYRDARLSLGMGVSNYRAMLGLAQWM